MSGTGSRFIEKGYAEIKPLVPVFGKPIIKSIVENFSDEDHFIFICRKEHLANKDLKLEVYLKSLATNTTVTEVENHKLGPVHSILQIQDQIDKSADLIVNYCDFDWRWNYTDFKKWLLEEKPKAALCVYSGFQPHYINPATYAYTRNHQNNVLEIREKQSFTKYREEEPAASGTFYFANGQLLLDACNWLVGRNENINGEYYVSLLYNYFPSIGMKTMTYFIQHFMQWGTPQDLEEFIFWARKVPLEFKTNIVDCPAVTLMAGKGSRMKSIDKVKKPYLKINKTSLFEFCTRNFQILKGKVIAVNGDQEDSEYLEKFDNLEIVNVGDTNSSVETLSTSIEKCDFNEKEELFVMPCDAAIDFDWSKFSNERREINDCAAVIFSFSGYPYAKWIPDQYGWLDINEDHSVKSVGLKKGWNAEFANPIVTGFFWFPNIGKLKVKLKDFLKETRDREASIDEFCGYLIEQNYKVHSYLVDDFLSLGVPEEFRGYEYWLNANEIAKLK